jgi:hypothetical protein
MLYKLAGERATCNLRLIIFGANLVALVFLVTAVDVGQYFNTDGFGQFADGL